MHIVLLNDDALPGARGGAAVVVDRLRRAYAAQGHDVTLVTTHAGSGRAVTETTDDAGTIVSIPVSTDPGGRHRYCVSPTAPVLGVLDEIFQKHTPDAVHAHNLHASLTYHALTVAKKYTGRIVLTAHDTFLVSFGRVKEARKLTLRDHLSVAGRAYWPFRNGAIRKILRQSETQVVAISAALKDFLECNGIPVAAMIHNGTEMGDPLPKETIDAFRSRYKLAGPTILFGGRVSGDKGIGALLSAWEIVRKKVPDAQLAVAGDRERAEKYVHGTEGVALLGHLSQEDMPLAYAAAAVVTTPSIYLDPFNLINIEAMAAGRPVVGTTFGGTPEIVKNGETGLLVDPRHTESFAGALVHLLRDCALAETMGRRGRERVREKFLLEQQCDAYLRLLETA